jgi:hypothetical protein
MLARRLVVITFSATVGLAFALHEGPREAAWSSHHLAAVSAPRTAIR